MSEQSLDKASEHSDSTHSEQDSALIIFSLALLVLNIFLMGMSTAPMESLPVLPNGDRVRPCGKSCFEVVDYMGVPVYKSNQGRRSIPLRPCEDEGCSGEYQFSTSEGEMFSLQLLNGTQLFLRKQI